MYGKNVSACLYVLLVFVCLFVCIFTCLFSFFDSLFFSVLSPSIGLFVYLNAKYFYINLFFNCLIIFWVLSLCLVIYICFIHFCFIFYYELELLFFHLYQMNFSQFIYPTHLFVQIQSKISRKSLTRKILQTAAKHSRPTLQWTRT